MEYGFNVPNGGPLAVPEHIGTIARHGEKLGYRILAIPDHIVVPKGIDSPYPYSPDGSLNFPTLLAGECLEPIALMAYLAGITQEMRLLSSVMVVPYRQPVLTAKLLSTIDLLSGGRVIVGVGAGWMAEEFPPVGAPPFEARGRATDEYLRIYKELWTADAPKYEGEFTSFDNILFHPKPVQQPHPPIWVGGESKPAKRRTARYGDAWFPIGCNPRFRWTPSAASRPPSTSCAPWRRRKAATRRRSTLPSGPSGTARTGADHDRYGRADAALRLGRRHRGRHPGTPRAGLPAPAAAVPARKHRGDARRHHGVRRGGPSQGRRVSARA